jgi:hypothetical protein
MFFAFFKFSHQAFLQKKLMFDVQSVRWSGQAEFHISAASGLKNGQSDQKRNFEKANIEYRIMNIEC